jgi:hypothetical protein
MQPSNTKIDFDMKSRVIRHSAAGVAIILAPLALAMAADTTRTTLWEGAIHLGDNAAQYSTATSGGMQVQIPCSANPAKNGIDPTKEGKLKFTTRDVQTLSGGGHYAELMAHYEDGEGPAREFVVQTFRLNGDSNNTDVPHSFEFDPMKGLYQKPAYYSVRVKVDTQIAFMLWDDFLLKRIEIEQ